MALTKVNNRMIDGAYVSPLDFNAVGNGTTDDSAAIQACVNAAPEGSIIDFGGLTFVCDDVSVTTNGITFQNGKLIAASTADSVSRLSITADDILLDNMTFYADGASYTRIGQVDAISCNNLRVTNCFFDGARRSGATQGGDHPLLIQNSTKALIQNNIFRNGEYTEQLMMIDCQYVTVDGNMFTGSTNTYSSVAIVSSDTSPDRSNYSVISNNVCNNFKTSVITINGEDNVVTGNFVKGSAEQQGIQFGHTSIGAARCIVSSNRIMDVIGSGIQLAASPNCTIADNWIENTNNSGIELGTNSENCTITDNFIKFVKQTAATTREANGIRLREDSNYCTISGNYLNNIDANGISIDGGKSYYITGNTFVNIHNYAGGLPGGRFVIDFTDPDANPEDFVVRNNMTRDDGTSVGVGPNRGVSIDPCNANLRAFIEDNDFTGVIGQDTYFGVTQPSPRVVRRNLRSSSDPTFAVVTIPGASTTLVVGNGNIRANGAYPKITPLDADAVTRNVYVTNLTDGSFTLNASAGFDAIVYWEL